MSRIAECFTRLAGKKALVPFITAGDPAPAQTVGLMHALVAGGADIIELGVPFSDPMADGPVIQRASERALKHQVSLGRVLEMVASFRQENQQTPVVLMGYLNPVCAMGIGRFCQQAKVAGVDGALTVDCPLEESDELSDALLSAGLDPIFLIAPTTPAERVAEIGKRARGFVYYVSLKGVTGAGHLDIADVSGKIAALRHAISVPIGVGFGIRDAQTAHALSQCADAIVVGSRLVQEIEDSPPGMLNSRLTQLVATLKSALD